MIGTIIIAVAAAIDGLATGIWIGKKWGTKVTTAALTSAGTTVAADVSKVEAAVAPTVTIAEADFKALMAHFEPAPKPAVVAPVAPPVAPLSPADASIKALLVQLQAQAVVAAPLQPAAPVALK